MFVRILNMVLALTTVVAIVVNYNVSEEARFTGTQLDRVERGIADAQAAQHDLQAQYVQQSQPERIHDLAVKNLGMTEAATIQLASLSALPRRGQEDAQTHEISAPAPQPADPHLVKIAVRN